jgi:arylsulfatase
VGSKLQTVESTKEIPTGKVLLSAAFVKENEGMPTTGTLSLFVNEEKVGEGRIMTQPGNFSLVGEGLNVGKDPAEPVCDEYPGVSPFAFTGGAIERVIIDVSGEPFIDLEKEAVAMMARE